MLKSFGLLMGIAAALIVASSAYAFLAPDNGRDSVAQTYRAIQPSKASQGQANQSAAMAEPLGKGAQRNAQAIATQFNMSPQDVVALHDGGFGFGAIVKLLVLAKAKGMSVNNLAASLPRVNGEPQANFGELFKNLSPEEKARIESLPKNLGQIKHLQAAKSKPK
jgi:hypothetical protein